MLSRIKEREREAFTHTHQGEARERWHTRSDLEMITKMSTTMTVLGVVAILACVVMQAEAQACLDPQWYTLLDLNPQRDQLTECPGEWSLVDAATNHVTNETHLVCARDVCVYDADTDSQICTEYSPPGGIKGTDVCIDPPAR